MPVSIAIISLAVLALLAPAASAQNCAPPNINDKATVESVRSHFQQRGRTVITFVGYSGADYEDRSAMLARAATVLDRLDPGKTIVNIGATIDGIGAVYQLAKQKGFETAGIVSSQARSTNATIAPCAGTVFFVEDESWGGLVKGPVGTMALSPTSAAIVAVSDQIVAIGGGDVARDEFTAATRLGKKTEFFPADMNHAIAQARAAKNKQPPPTDFRGALAAALAGAGK